MNRSMKIRNPIRLFQYVLLIVLILIRFVVFAQNNFTCSDNLYQVVNGKDLKYLNPATGEYVTIGTSAINYNGAGFNYQDNYIYGIGSGNVLVRIDNTGQATDLGSIQGFSVLSYSGDLDTLGNWVGFRKASNTWRMNTIDVSAATPVAIEDAVTELSGEGSAANCADISFNAISGKFYGMNSGKLIEFDPVNKTVKVIADYSEQAAGGSYGAVWSDSAGNTYFFNNGTGNIYKAVINSAAEVESFGFVAVSAPNGMNDGMSCALGAPPVFPEICNNGFDDDGDGLVDCEDPDCTGTTECGVSATVYSSEKGCEGSIVTNHLFFTNHSNLSNSITVTDVMPAGFTFLQDTIEFDAGGSSSFLNQPAEGDQGTLMWGTFQLAAGETVRISYDMLVGSGVSYGTNQNLVTAELSREQTILTPSQLSNTIEIAEECPAPNVFNCEPAFYQVYKKRGKEQPNLYGKLDPITGDYLQIAVASDYANGLGFDVNTGLVYGASGKRFIQLDEDGLVIDQGITFDKKVYRGDINQNSEWYGVVGGDMVKINVSGTPQLTATYAGEGLPGWDIAYNEDGHFYSIHNGTLYKFDTGTNLKSTIASLTGAGLPTSGGYGAQWTGSDGYLYASHNASGSILRIDVATGEARIVSSSVSGLSKNDGFSCPMEIPAVYEFDYGDNSRLPQSRILAYKQDISNDGLPDYAMVWLGNTVDFDTSDPANVDADGDSDDGVSVNTRINNNQVTTILGLNANHAVSCYYLLGIDWDDDGAFDEVIAGNQALEGAASIPVALNVPAGFINGNVNVRAMVSEQELTTDHISGDIVAMGEVEDYRLLITSDEDCSNGIDDDADGLIDCDDPDCAGVASCPETPTGPGGGDGGLESNDRLADKIAAVRFARAKNPTVDYDDKKALPRLERGTAYGKSTAGKLQNDAGIERFIPIDVIEGAETYVTSPNHLTDITNATEVFAADVFRGDSRVAAILALTSENGVYEHTKYVCDRLSGSEILDILNYQIDEQHAFQIAKMLLPGGNVEYATSFSVREEGADFVLESHWNLEFYTPEVTYYNFQIWAASTEKLSTLVNEMLRLLQLDRPIAQWAIGDAPEFFVNKAEVSYGQLSMQVTNRSEEDQIMATGFYRSTETANKEQFEELLTLQPRDQEELQLNVTGIYDLGLTFSGDRIAMPDVIFMADGVWGTDFDEQIEQVDEFTISTGQASQHVTRALERDVRLAGEVQESVAVFRSLNATWRPTDISKYNYLTFAASGTAQVEVTLVKSGVKDWADQPRFFFNLVGTEREIQIHKGDFMVGEDISREWDDIVSVVFDVRGNQSYPTSFELDVSNVGFTNNIITSVGETEVVPHTVYPNPAKDHFTFSFTSGQPDDYALVLVTQTGQVLKEWNGMIEAGANQLVIDGLPDTKGLYFYQFTTGSGQQAKGKVFVID